ncbi:MAG TPA: hypothetical protein VG889_05640 [Rhizomicrobium sp.]|nr:hypothetical protein [Rhizomicrobium sp.]
MSTASEPMTVNSRQHATRPFAWSVRRELWEHRSVYIAPLAAAGLVLLGFLVRIFHLPQTMKMLSTLKPEDQHLALSIPFAIAAVAVCIAGLIVAFFYCLGALHGERRDRSILFWKSLPVSNATVVLSKAAIPFVVLPVVLFATIVATHLIMLGLGSAALATTGHAGLLWASWPLLKMSLVLVYALVVMTLWYAPIYGWLLLVSGWARSMAILWAVLPPLGLVLAERIAFDTSYLGRLLDYRLNGFVREAFTFDRHDKAAFGDPLSLLTPERFLSTSGLWIGIVLGVSFLAAAIWLRRNREPI